MGAKAEAKRRRSRISLIRDTQKPNQKKNLWLLPEKETQGYNGTPGSGYLPEDWWWRNQKKKQKGSDLARYRVFFAGPLSSTSSKVPSPMFFLNKSTIAFIAFQDKTDIHFKKKYFQNGRSKTSFFCPIC